jgi:hypothetical protein
MRCSAAAVVNPTAPMNQPSAACRCIPREIKKARGSSRTTGPAARKKPSHNLSSSVWNDGRTTAPRRHENDSVGVAPCSPASRVQYACCRRRSGPTLTRRRAADAARAGTDGVITPLARRTAELEAECHSRFSVDLNMCPRRRWWPVTRWMSPEAPLRRCRRRASGPSRGRRLARCEVCVEGSGRGCRPGG